MSSLKELRKLAEIGPGYYAVMPDGSVKAATSYDETTMTGYKALYSQGTDKKWQEYDGGTKKWKLLSEAPKAVVGSTDTKPAAATKTPTPITHNKGTYLVDATYHYFVNGPLSFNWWPLDDHTKIKEFNSSNKNWEKAVKAINLLPPVTGANSTAATPKDQQATTAPGTEPEVAKPAETPQSTTQPATDQLTANVAKILSNIDAGHTYGGRTLFTNEKAIVRNKIAALKKWAAMRNAAIDAPLQLAMIVVAYNRQSLASSRLAAVGPEELSAMSERDIQKSFGQELSTILRGVTSFAKMTADQLAEYNKAKRKAAAKYPAKIIRLASLRRLRVRSEMEAAITGSAMPGRDRVS